MELTRSRLPADPSVCLMHSSERYRKYTVRLASEALTATGKQRGFVNFS